MARKTIRELYREEEQKQLAKLEQKLIKQETKLLAKTPLSQSHVVLNITQSRLPVYIARGWEVMTTPGFSSRTYTLRIPRVTLEERING